MGACIRGFWCLTVFLTECDGVKQMQGCEEGVGSDGRQRRGKEEEARETLLGRMAIGLWLPAVCSVSELCSVGWSSGVV